MKAYQTEKEIRFIAFGAEEIGLVGFRYYVSQLSEEDLNRISKERPTMWPFTKLVSMRPISSTGSPKPHH